MAELTPPGFDNMVRVFPSWDFKSSHVPFTIHSVLRPLWPIQPRLVNDWAERHSSHHRQHWKQLDGIPFPVRVVFLCVGSDLVWRRHT